MNACISRNNGGGGRGFAAAATYDCDVSPRMPAIIRPTDAIEWKFVGVIREAGIMTSNSASILSINATMSSEVKPSCANSPSSEIDTLIERVARISATSRNKRPLIEPASRPDMSFFSDWPIPFNGAPNAHTHRQRSGCAFNSDITSCQV
jgi:hypothetical protein